MKKVVKVSINTNKINPPNQNNVNNPQTNPNNNIKVQSQTQNSQTPQQNLNNMSIEQLYQLLLQQLQQQKQQDQSQNSEFIVKANMKASYVALKIEQVLLLKKKVTLSALGYAIPAAIDAVMLIRKDLSRQQINIKNTDIELFEKEVLAVGNKNKIVSGVRITLSI